MPTRMAQPAMSYQNSELLDEADDLPELPPKARCIHFAFRGQSRVRLPTTRQLSYPPATPSASVAPRGASEPAQRSLVVSGYAATSDV